MFIPLKDENPTSHFPFFTLIFIGLNTLIFFYHAFSPQGGQYFAYRLGAIPYEITHFQQLIFTLGENQRNITRLSPPLTLLTSMFVHGSLFHLLGNMLYLWIFGNNVEDFLGHFRFIIFYFFTGLCASLTQIAFNPNSKVPMIGASGAIAGILGSYLILFPRARVLTLVFLFYFIRIVPIPAFFVLGVWFILQVMNVGLGGGVAWFAHIGGFVAGMLLIRLFLKKRYRRWVN